MFRLKYITLYVLTILLMIVGGIFLKEDFFPFFRWWLSVFVLGILFLPLTRKMFSSYHDGGYLFSKVIGIASSGYLMWLLSSLKILKFTEVSCYIVLAGCLIINGILFLKSKKEEKMTLLDSDHVFPMIAEEVLFLFIFLIWAYIRGFRPEAHGTEKFMDYGFMAAMMRGDYMPPKDLWFSGSTINYYYVGQYMSAFLTKLSLNSVNVGYNLMLTMLAALSFMLPYSLVYNITKNRFGEKYLNPKWIPRMAGILSGAGVSLAGNLHFTLYYWVVPTIRKILGIEGDFADYWFPNSTRYIGYNPETADKTIHEFPGYSFVLGDLHAHVINIVFVLTLLGILFAWLLYQKRRLDNREAQGFQIKQEILNPFIISIGFFIGLFHTTNFWDFPIYYVVAGGVILFFNGVIYEFRLKTLLITGLQGVFIITLSELISLPFTLNFDQISTEIMLTEAHTPLYQLLILWGLPVILIIGFLYELAGSTKYKSQDDNPKFILFRFLNSLSPSDLYILVLGLCAIGLVIMPEVIYVKDIYSGDYKRANTMFKLTYQAFIMFGICSGYIFMKFKKLHHFNWQKTFANITLFLFLTTFWYPVVSVKAWYIKDKSFKDYKGLDAAEFLNSADNQEDYRAINWLNNNIKGTPVILEAHGDSYTDYGRVSVFTGLPTVLGWYVHEWLWRGDTDIVNKRAADIETIYTSTDQELVQTLIDKYEIEYIYVGKLERVKYNSLNSDLLKRLGRIVYKGSEDINDTYIIQIEPKG
ncbi:DUF2298 domain-containing protein [Anaerocolumna aminovalerica]|jgi:uncharacterized membrane protein|uniref:DUF2298 domain-containing protein n=1 Tax=Anaerocolumna aminovalerica TaxID=1527 RepID=UPI00248C1535|nr:DUF2298 domain-containing protein [Anaerocolumna aminovalerica]